VAEDLEKRVLSRVGRRRILVTFPARNADELVRVFP
jgi:origin recognition complex subunit 4